MAKVGKKEAAISAKDGGSSKPSPQRPSPTAVDEDIAVGAVLDETPPSSSPAKKKAKTSKAASSTATAASTEDAKAINAAPKRRRATSKKAMILEKAASEDVQHTSSTKSPAKKKSSSKTSKAVAKKKDAKSTNGKSKAAASSSAVPDDAKNAKKKRSWTKPKDKPKRPLSAYNLFFRDEREKLLKDAAPPTNGETTSSTANGTSSTQSEGTNGTADSSSGQPAKRRHRKSHGKIGFAQLAQHIAAKWKALDADARKPYEKEAEGEKARYRVELEKWRVTQKAKQEQLLQNPEQAQMDAQEEAALTLQALRANTPPPVGAAMALSGGAPSHESHALPAAMSSADPTVAALHGEVTQMEPI